MSSITEFLNSLHSHLQAQSHLLPSLHDQLGLPVSALEEELAAIKQILIDSVEAQIESRRQKSKFVPYQAGELSTLSSHLHAMARVLGEIFIPDVLDDDLDTSTHRDVTPRDLLEWTRTRVVKKKWTPSSLDDLPSSLLSPPSFSSSIITSTPFAQTASTATFRESLPTLSPRAREADDEGNPLIGLEHVDPNPVYSNGRGRSVVFGGRQTQARDPHTGHREAIRGQRGRHGCVCNAHQGWTNATVKAYQDQLGRMRQVKRERMSMFVQNAREEIIKLWDELMVAEEERQGFAALSDDVHTEQLLNIHESRD
ncbi:hypothetical protein BDZ89DRAFT_1055538 [Hymenopellis radicata]|nr:hypothetical protein BDZ89DRAFT_1055538 [Hymenopellis radicata]